MLINSILKKAIKSPIVIFILTICMLSIFRSSVNSQEIIFTNLPIPTVMVDIRTGSLNSQVTEENTFSVISWTIDPEGSDTYGFILEATTKESPDDKVILKIYDPQQVGDDFVANGGTYITNVFSKDKSFIIYVTTFDRLGNQSQPGIAEFTVKPYEEPECGNEVFKGVKQEVVGPTLLISWDNVCLGDKIANKYIVYRNGVKRGETPGGAPLWTDEATTGNTWKIEAYGDSPTNRSTVSIKTCQEATDKLLPTMLFDRSTGEYGAVEKCQIVNGWVRTIVRFAPRDEYDSPLSMYFNGTLGSLVGYSYPPAFNYPLGQISPHPFYSKHFLWNGFDECAISDPSYGRTVTTDPWKQLDWTCQSDFKKVGTYIVPTNARYWVNFDPKITSGKWPIRTEFNY